MFNDASSIHLPNFGGEDSQVLKAPGDGMVCCSYNVQPEKARWWEDHPELAEAFHQSGPD